MEKKIIKIWYDKEGIILKFCLSGEKDTSEKQKTMQ